MNKIMKINEYHSIEMLADGSHIDYFKKERTAVQKINDQVEKVMLALWETPDFNARMTAAQEPNKGKWHLTEQMFYATTLIKEYAPLHGYPDVAALTLYDIDRALKVALRRYGISIGKKASLTPR